MQFTRPVVPSEWLGTELEWSGSIDGVEPLILENLIINNMSFVVSMIILPFVIIGLVVV